MFIINLAIEAFLSIQLFMVPSLDNASLVEYNDLVKVQQAEEKGILPQDRIQEQEEEEMKQVPYVDRNDLIIIVNQQ